MEHTQSRELGGWGGGQGGGGGREVEKEKERETERERVPYFSQQMNLYAHDIYI